MIGKLWRKLFPSVEPLPLRQAQRFLPLLRHVHDSGPDATDTETQDLFSAALVARAEERGLIRWASHQLPEWDFYALTELGRATLKAHTEAQCETP